MCHLHVGEVGNMREDIPLALAFACEDDEPQAVPIAVSEGQRLVVVVEPGYSPGYAWHQIRDFMAQEGI